MASHSQTAVIMCSTAIVTLICKQLYENSRRGRSYQVIPIHAAKRYTDGAKKVIGTEWQSNAEIEAEKILPTHLLLLYFQNGSDKDKEGRVIGQVSIGGRLADPNHTASTSRWKARSDPVLYLTALVVHPEFRGNGWGKTLMAAAYEYCVRNEFMQKGIKRMEGQTGSRALVRFYSKLGANVSEAEQKLQQELSADFPHKKMGVDLADDTLRSRSRQILNKQARCFNFTLSF